MLPTSLLAASVLISGSSVPGPLALSKAHGAAYFVDDGDEEVAEEAAPGPEGADAEVEDELAPEDELDGGVEGEDGAGEDGAGEDEPEDSERHPSEITIPRYRGTGLLLTAGVLGGFAAGMMGLRVARIQQFCTAEGLEGMTVTEENIDSFISSSAECFVAGRGLNAALWVFQAAPNAVTWGLAPAGAMRRAKYDAARSVKTGEVDRSPGAWIGAGAAVLGAGVLGRILVATIRIRSLNPLRGVASSCVNGESTTGEFFDCYADRNSLLYGMHQLTSSAIGAGAGMLTYGLVYKSERKTLSQIYGLSETTRFEFSVQPQLAMTYTGAAAVFRF